MDSYYGMKQNYLHPAQTIVQNQYGFSKYID